MADNFVANPGSGGDTFRADDLSGVKVPGSKIVLGADNVDEGYVGSTNPMPALSKVQNAVGTTINPATSADITGVVNAVLSTLSVAAAGTFPVSGPLTDTQLRATAVPVTGPLTDTQLRATAVPVSGTLTVSSTSVISTVNSSTATLLSGATFTGTSEDVSNYSTIQVYVFSNVASATDGFSSQQSSDGTNWDVIDTYTIAAGTGKTFSFQPAGKFYRIVYTNGGTNQTSFRLQTIFHRSITKGSSQRPQDALSNENDFEEVIATLLNYNGTTWDRVRGDTTGGLWAQLKAALPAGSATIGAVLNAMVTPTTGTITANGQTVTCALAGAGGGVLAYSGTFSGINASFQASYDGGTNYTNHIVANVAGTVPSAGLSGVSTGVAAFIFYCPGATHFRINCTAFTSGTMAVTINPLSVSHPGFIEGRVSGFDASNAAATVNPFQIAIRASSSDPAVNSTNTLVVPLASQLGKPVVLPFAIANNTWTYAAAAGGLVTTAGITVKAAGAAGIRNYITHIDVVNSHATIGTDIQIRDGASGTVLWRGWAQPAGGGISADFNPPLRGTAATLVEIAEGTATGTTGVYCNLSGYQAGE